MIIASLVRIVYPLKNPSNACLSNLDNGSFVIYDIIEVSICQRCLTGKTPVNRCLHK